MVFIIGHPGSGKSTYCHQTVLNALAINRPVIFVVTEQGPADVTQYLRDQGLGELLAGSLTFVDAFHETLGLPHTGRPDTVDAHFSDLTSLEVAISKLQNKFQQKNILLVFDSLTSPYLLTGSVIIKFMRFSLMKFAAANCEWEFIYKSCWNKIHN